ncbi:MAG: glycosyltransferase family 4 protein [Clostridia bacterium]|nr:glycosyltransferase family 4 protein [Clostridia bacterium]
MRILLVSFSEHYANQETIYNLFDSLKQDVDIWTLGMKKLSFKAEIEDRNILVDCPKRPGIEKDTFDFRKFRRVLKIIRNINPDVILFYNAHIWNIMLIMRLKKIKIYHVIHDVIPHKSDRHEKFVYIYNWITARIADRVVLHSSTFKKDFCKRFRFPEEKLLVTELWRKYEEFVPVKNTGRCLFFGRINHYKGIDYLLEIVQKCPNIQFDVVGRVDDGLETTMEKLRQLPNVHLNNGYIDGELMRLYFVNADWVILPYKSATQSGVVIDAYCFSRPVIAFDVGALSEQVSQGISGFLVDEADVDGFVEVLKDSVGLSSSKKNEFAKNAWEYGYKKYSIQEGAKRLLQILND